MNEGGVKLLLNKTKIAAKAGNIFEARSWLLTTKSIYPTEFSVHFQAYKLEYEEKNAKECAAIITDIFRQFPNEKEVWVELESMVTAICNEEDNLKKDIFGLLKSSLQQQVMIMCMGKEIDVTEHCKLMIVLMKRFPDTVMQFGVSMTEKLVEDEKTYGAGTALNKYRRLLVCDILPVVCSSECIEVSQKHFYKWLQKAAEFYATYYTRDRSVPLQEFSPIENPWQQCETLLENIAEQCGWSISDANQRRTIKGRMSHISDLHRKSRTDVLGVVNKKQIFYTAILLLVEAASKYAEVMLPTIYNESSDSNMQGHVILDDIVSDSDESNPKKVRRVDPSISSDKACEYFHVARDAWNILHSNDSFEKDFSHLYRRWKMDRWVWLQLLLADYHMFNGYHKSALVKLENLMQQDLTKTSKSVILRASCHLASAYHATKQLQMSCQAIFDSLNQLPSKSTNDSSILTYPSSSSFETSSTFPLNVQNVASKTKLQLVPLNFQSLIPYWIEILIQSFLTLLDITYNDIIVGHTLVLLQYKWPKHEDQTTKLLSTLSEKEEFKYTLFFDYIITMDILEEFAYIKNQEKCKLSLLPTAPTLNQRVTRGVNKEFSEDFNKALERQVGLSDTNLLQLLRKFLIDQQDSILNCLNSEEMARVEDTIEIN